MRAARPGKVQSSINVTPLVDVVLVLLIIFMVIAPQLQQGPAMQLPTTSQPQDKPDDGRQILVAIERGGKIWIDNDQVSQADFAAGMQQVATDRADWNVVIKGDARLSYGEVKQAMLAVEAAGFKNVGLVAEREESLGGEE